MGKSSPPEPPDPQETATAQTGTNVSTALANTALKNVNQVTPNGNLTYNQTGAYKWVDPTSITEDNPKGVTYKIPTFTATQTLSKSGKNINKNTTAAQLNLAQLAKQQSGFLQNYLKKPVDLSNNAVEKRLMQLGRKRLDPILAQRTASLDTSLANKGIHLGSAAYDRAMTQNTQGQNDAYDQLLLSGHQQGVSDILAQRNQPLNEISALMSGSQLASPNYVNTSMPTIPTTDFAGITEQNYQDRLNAYQMQQQQTQGLLGGLFGLGSSLIKASDRRLKKDIRKVGDLGGQKVYEYGYKAGGPMQLGLMAQEVEKKTPDAVITTRSGYKAVDYGKAFGLGAH